MSSSIETASWQRIQRARAAEFLERLVDTQMMQMFFEDRVFAPERNFEVELFDAHIDQLMGTASHEKQESSFLADTSQDVRETHDVAPPNAEEFGGAGPFKCSGAPFAQPLEWNGLPKPKPVPSLTHVHRGSQFLRRASRVTKVLEALYVNFYTKKRIFKARFRFFKQRAESALGEVQDLLSMIEHEVSILKRFEKGSSKL